MSRPRVLVLAKSYPNPVFEAQGLWVERLVRQSTNFCEPKVISPIAYCPPLLGLPRYYTRLRSIPQHRWLDGIEVFHPRFFTGPGYSLRPLEAAAYYWAARRVLNRLRPHFPFDLIHAHFTYPDGYVAVRLSRIFEVPVIITEHNLWGAWMDHNWIVRRQTIRAARECMFHVAVSTAVRESIVCVTGESEKLRIISNAVDGSAFTLPKKDIRSRGNQIIFLGAIRHVKGVDVLLRAVQLLNDAGRDVNLVLVGESYFKDYQREYERMRKMSREMGLGNRVSFVGKKLMPELLRYLQESTLLVLPSHAESFGVVLIEALACGTPVVATRCGGPEDIVNDRVGVLVPPANPELLARGIEGVLDRRESFDPEKLRTYALENFGSEVVGRRLSALYEEALARRQKRN
jgi:glycosyltransferase involved in cell wall biosynthesis